MSKLAIKTKLSKIPLLGDTLFKSYKINEIVNKFLLVFSFFISKMHLRQPGFTRSACGSFIKNKKKEYKNLKKQDIQYIFIKIN